MSDEMLSRMTPEGFLASLSLDEADALRAAGVRRTYGANVTLLHQADEAGPVVVLVRGRAKIAVLGDDREAILGVVGRVNWSGSLRPSRTARARRRSRRSNRWTRWSYHALTSWHCWIGGRASRS
jgi:CRP-like cAMP-binding protein